MEFLLKRQNPLYRIYPPREARAERVTRYVNPATGKIHELHTPVAGHEGTLQLQLQRHGINPNADLDALFAQLV